MCFVSVNLGAISWSSHGRRAIIIVCHQRARGGPECSRIEDDYAAWYHQL